jgi:hypothetical protein
MGEAREQQASEVFLSTLATLVEHRQVFMDSAEGDDAGKVIGKAFRGVSGAFEVSTKQTSAKGSGLVRQGCSMHTALGSRPSRRYLRAVLSSMPAWAAARPRGSPRRSRRRRRRTW